MTEEKKPVEPAATDASQGGPVPDPSRRRLAKAALASPVLMTLAPRSVLGQGVGPCSATVTASFNAAGASVSAAVQECIECQENYKAKCPSDAANALAQCHISSDPECPTTPTSQNTPLLDQTPVKKIKPRDMR